MAGGATTTTTTTTTPLVPILYLIAICCIQLLATKTVLGLHRTVTKT
jgi:hypothetical protein